MKSHKLTVAALLGLVVAFFVFGMYAYQKRIQTSQLEKVQQDSARLVRFNSTVIGPKDAPVTIVEFFDPACETCRAFYPLVKELMRKNPTDIRLVLRYAPFHQGSDQVVKLLEASKKQDKYLQTLEAILAAQPMWADHEGPKLELAYQAAEKAGIDLKRALEDAKAEGITAILTQDVEDLTALEVTKTPTFFVNGRSLPSFGAEQLQTLVAEELAKVKK